MRKKDDNEDLHIGLFTMYIIDYGWLYDYKLTYSLNPRRKTCSTCARHITHNDPWIFQPGVQKRGCQETSRYSTHHFPVEFHVVFLL